MLACEKGNKDAVNVLLDAGADPNIADGMGATCIHRAVFESCSKDLLETIVNHGADVNATNKKKVTALMLACETGNKDAVNVLLDAGADHNSHYADGYTLLHDAVRGGYSEAILETIINHGADVNATNKNNVTALMIACGKGNKGAINMLLNAGADPNITDDMGATCIHHAVGEGCSKDVLETIMNHDANVNARNKKNVTALMIACVKGKEDAINVLLDSGADPNITDADGNTSLHYAAQSDCCTQVLQEIINHSADVNATNKKNVTALMIACVKGKEDAINVLLIAGADPHVADVDGNSTCLHSAVRNDCSTEVLHAIISHGGYVNATNKNNRTALLIACTKGHKDVINMLLNAGADPNITDDMGATCIHRAVFKGCSKDVVETIVDHGADVNAADKKKVTPLMLACEKGNKDATSVLLDVGADPNLADGRGATCIHRAVLESCSKDLLETIVNHGADVNATNKKKVTALMLACETGNKDAVNVLLDAGADPNVTDGNGATCIHHAVAASCSKVMLETIVNHGADVNATNTENRTALMLACRRNKDVINALLIAGADPNITDVNGDTCIHRAVGECCSKDVLETIVSHGADVNATNKKKVTALMLACEKGDKDAINVLLDAGADPNIVDGMGATCIHRAVFKGCSKDVLETIVDHGADINATNKKKVTALMLACETGNKDAVNVLLDAGADHNSHYADGYTLLHDAVRGGYSEAILETIINHGADVNATNKNNVTALMIACGKGNKDAINMLLNAGADPNITDDMGATCIHHAVGEGCSKDVLETIMNHNANVNARNKNNVTALMLACKEENEDAINVLLDAGADPNIADGMGATCIHHAIVKGCSKDVLEKLVDHGANVNATDKKIVTALMLACETGNKYAINVLLDARADPNMADSMGATCIHSVVFKGYSKDVLETFVDHGADVNATNKKNVTALMIACKKGNKEAINALLNAGADPNITDDMGATCIHHAVAEGCSKDVLETIVDHGANVNARNKKKVTALMLACKKRNKDVVKVLLDAGADPNIADGMGATCIHHAVAESCTKDVLETIVNHGADVNATCKEKVTALMLACEKESKDAINVLLDARADPNMADHTGATCIHRAVFKGCSKDVLETIVDHGADVNATNKKKVTALMIACEKGNNDAINVLLNAGADPNIADVNGDTCLYNAVIGDCSITVIQTIINSGGNVNATNRYYHTPLILACFVGNIDAVNVFLCAGADPNIVDTDGKTWLHSAVFGLCRKEVIQEIVDHGADVNATDKQNQTAMVLACQYRHVDAVNVLLISQADPNIADAKGNTLLHNAVLNNVDEQTLKEIINHGADVNAVNIEGDTALILACDSLKRELVNVLLGAGGDTSAANVYGDTCLHKVIHNKYSGETGSVFIRTLDRTHEQEILQLLLDHGAPVNAANKNHQTAYMLACDQGNIGAKCALLNAGADPSIIDFDGNTSLHTAVLGSCSKTILERRIDHGVDVNTVNKHNHTALIVACVKKNIDAVHVLLNAGADTNIADNMCATCLHYAVLGGCTKDALQKIVDHGANVNAKNRNIVTALHSVCYTGNVDAVNVLLKAGADVNIVDDKGSSWLHYAVLGGCSKEFLQSLIDHGANVNATNHGNITSLMMACKKGNADAVTVLLKAGADANIVAINGNTWLHGAVVGDCSKEVLQMIIDHGADVNATNNKNLTALVMACEKGNIDAINVLLNAGADTSIVSVYGNTWLHFAVLGGSNKAILHRIFDHGTDVNAVNNEGATSLMLACETGQRESVNVLLRAGADTPIVDVHGDTCLHKLFQKECNQEILQILLDHGAPVNATNKNHQTAYMLAYDQGNRDAMQALFMTNAGAYDNIDSGDDDTNICCSGCCSNISLHAILQWLNST